MRKKIVITTGTRADYGILRPVLNALLKSKKLEMYLIVTGSHLSKKHGFSITEVKKDGFKIYKTVDMIPKGNTNYEMSLELGKGIISFSNIFRQLKPDINLVFGDRDEMLASAIAASHMNIPNAHIHGGDKTIGSIDEYNRHVITKLSNIHFAASTKSFNRIKKMGENPKNVFLTGSPSIDEITSNCISNKRTLEKKFKIKFTGKEILLVYHPVTTQTEIIEKQILNILKALIKIKQKTFVLAPNSDAGNREIFKNLNSYSRKYQFIRLFRNLPRRDYLGLLRYCGVLVGNSSSGIIEASYFDIPVVNIGIRQKGREGNKKIIHISPESPDIIYNVIRKSLNKKRTYKIKKSGVYGKGNSSKKIVKILEKTKLDKKLIQKQIFY